MPEYLIGVDNGGTVTKVGVYDTDGTEVATASRTTQMLFPQPEHTEREMEQIWNANIDAIRDALQKSGVRAQDVAGISTTGHGNGVYFLGPNGEYVENGIVSTDNRAADYVRRWNEDGTTRRLYRKTLQNIWSGQTAALLAWYRDHKPSVLDQSRWIMSCKDFVRYQLTGEVATEYTDLSGMNLMDVRNAVVDREVLDGWGIGFAERLIPDPIWSTEAAGTITRDVARQTGLKEGTTVAGGLFDITAMAIATGALGPENLCVIGGTWSINEFVSPVAVESDEIAMNSLYCIPGLLLINDSTPTSASNLEWFVSQLLSFGRREHPDRDALFRTCNEAVAGTSEQESDIVFLPFLFGSNVSPNPGSAFFGLSGWHETPHLIRAVYEGIVFSHKTHIDRLRRHRDEPFTSIRISGGVAKSDVWVQMFADVLQIPVETTTGEELGCLGAAMAAGVAAGVYESLREAVGRTVRVKRVVEPRPGVAERYAEKYARYQAVTRALGQVERR